MDCNNLTENGHESFFRGVNWIQEKEIKKIDVFPRKRWRKDGGEDGSKKLEKKNRDESTRMCKTMNTMTKMEKKKEKTGKRKRSNGGGSRTLPYRQRK